MDKYVPTIKMNDRVIMKHPFPVIPMIFVLKYLSKRRTCKRIPTFKKHLNHKK